LEGVIMTKRERGEAFVRAIETMGRPQGGGQVAVNYDDVLALVREDLESAAAFVMTSAAPEVRDKRYLQRGAVVARAYAEVTGDDSLVSLVERAAKGMGVAPSIKYANAPSPDEDDGSPSRRPLIALTIDRPTVDRGDAYGMITRLSLENAAPDVLPTLRAMRARCVLSFALDDDPRHIFQIPSARKFLASLFKGLPYFAYYLNMKPEAYSFVTFFGSLADPAAFNGNGFDLMHPSVLSPVVISVVAIRRVCRQLGWDARPAVDAVLLGYPAHAVRTIVAKAEAAGA
jgi:hypothetical protein